MWNWGGGLVLKVCLMWILEWGGATLSVGTHVVEHAQLTPELLSQLLELPAPVTPRHGGDWARYHHTTRVSDDCSPLHAR